MKNIERPLLVIAIGMIIGIIIGLYFKISMVLFFSFLIIAIMKNKKTNKYINKKAILLMSASILVFIIYVQIIGSQYENYYRYSEKKIEINAIVVSDAKQGDYYKSYEIKTNNKKFILYTKQDLKYGTLIKIKGNFIKPEGARNYKGFNYEQYLKSKKIYGSIKSEEIEIIENNKINIIQKNGQTVRNKIKETAIAVLPQNIQGLLVGILIGDRTNISEELTQDFSKSSLTHILAISGSHISYIILGVTYILLKSKIPRRIAYIITNLVLIFFMFITGFSASVVRASTMGILLISAKLVYRKPDIINSIAISLIIIFIDNPFAIYDIGLQLSYLGTLGIVIFSKPISNKISKKIPKKISEMMAITISAQILILPIIMLNFNTVSLTFLISNIIAVPISGIIMIYGYITSTIGIVSIEFASFLAIGLNVLLNILIITAKIVGNMPFSNIIIPTPHLIYILIYYLIIINFKKKKVRKILLIIFLIILTINFIQKQIPQNLKIHIIDVGQGDSSLIITPNRKTLLIDTGEQENTLLEYLLDRQILEIDYALISHFDSDHCFNLIEVIENLKVSNILISKQTEETELFKKIIGTARRQNVNIIVVEAGQTIKIDKEVTLKILWPTKVSNNSMNENSIVAKLEYKNFSMLFTGDIGEKTENKLLEIYSQNMLKSTILKVAHHGAKTSSNINFLNTVMPQIAIIGVGKNNKFGHPDESVIENLTKIKSKIFRTDINGEITIKVDKNARIKINCMNM